LVDDPHKSENINYDDDDDDDNEADHNDDEDVESVVK
jgi:hypothetical protein